MRIKLAELCNYLEAQLLSGNVHQEVRGVAIDSRKINGGELFFALSGENTDGHNFLDVAAHAGAIAAVVEKDVEIKNSEFALLKVKNTKLALQKTAEFSRNTFKGYVVGITGSNGKTTTKDLIAAVLEQKFATTKTYANYNNEVGLPLTILNASEETEVLVLEMGMRAQGEIALLANIARPCIGVITNIGISHIEILKTQDNIALAKFELIDALSHLDTAVLNADDEWCVRLAPTTCQTLFYGFDKKADLRCVDYFVTEQGTQFMINYDNKQYPAFLPTWGKHNVTNALAAVCVGVSLGMEIEQAINGLKTYCPSPMRLEVKIGKNGLCLLDDAYNANPVSMSASLEVLKSIAKNRSVAVLGEMYELGDMAQEGHKNVGKFAKNQNIDILVVVGEMGRWIAEGALEQGMQSNVVFHFDNNTEAVSFLKGFLRTDDTVLVKGSRGMKMETIISALT